MFSEAHNQIKNYIFICRLQKCPHYEDAREGVMNLKLQLQTTVIELISYKHAQSQIVFQALQYTKHDIAGCCNMTINIKRTYNNRHNMMPYHANRL